MLNELKAFLFRGNVLDLAIAVVVGAAFKAIVDSLVTDIITPIIGAIFNVKSFKALQLGVINIGSFIDAVINFLIIGTVLFFVVKMSEKLTSLRKEQEAKDVENAPAGPTQEQLLAEIRDLLRIR
ncbi:MULTISPECIES: large conductance mechanosensitive channel protein MscL [unclassified Granulicatella]|uniref:large conductance mechanosensitive channel protein MscL n=1 Tax=unclassified Granulicatella TaxID=2630493 RepID=UPI0010737351|nr:MULTISPECIES: large conductance mechanosensitive channel protein MscL [unclassified Granulicatella]MBF0780836.1 large conductance mechanosensitive channel protein MscL [Granulicatella sp. 19428wC4_WM01]TFU93526.1 large conductance mechanosensitive channel protein MscL [Granulicatella sp. WM01]